MNKNKITAVLIIVIIVAIASFYGGTKYSGGKTAGMASPRGQFARNGFGTTTGRGGGAGGGFVSGSILSKDAASLTIGLQGGGSKIVLLATSTLVTKTTTGSTNDLTAGTEVTAIGSSNSDGSITAESVQIRPVGMNSRGFGQNQ